MKNGIKPCSEGESRSRGASSRVTALKGARVRVAERPRWIREFVLAPFGCGGSVCESNAPATGFLPPAGFEDREDHRTLCASNL